MCNLYGFYKKHITGVKEGYPEITPDRESLKLRGRDAFGVVYIDWNKGLKKTVTSKIEIDVEHLQDLIYLAFESRAIPEPELIEHGREGLVPQRDTQPFYNERWVTSHNGTIIQPDKLIEKYNLKPSSPVDSAVLPELFKTQLTPEYYLREVLNGSFALAVYDRELHKLHLMATFQPMYYVETEDYVYYASIEEQLVYLRKPIVKVQPYSSVIFEGERKRVESLYRNDISNKVLVICSGGLDSVTTARFYQVLGYDVSCLHFLYAQAAETVEDQMVKRICKFYKYPLIELNVRNVFKKAAASSRLLSKKPAESALEDAEGTPSYVGNRNMIFASIAAGIAEENNMGRVVMGLNLSDGSGYPDNCVPYLLNMEATLKTSLNQQKRVLFRSPFVNLMKHEVLQVAIAVGSPLQWQASCYYPTLENDNPKYCKGCGSHLLRSYAFKYLGYRDPVPYEEDFDFGKNAKDLPEDFWKRVSNINLRLNIDEIPFANQMKWSL